MAMYVCVCAADLGTATNGYRFDYQKDGNNLGDISIKTGKISNVLVIYPRYNFPGEMYQDRL